MKHIESVASRINGAVVVASSLGFSTISAKAAVVSLDFEGINATYPSGFASIKEFYNGGTGSDGTSGTNYGVSFGDNALALCLNTLTGFCSNASRVGLGSPTSQ